MKTAQSIAEQDERKAARNNGENQAGSSRANTLPARKKSGRGDATRIAPWRWPAGVSGNPSGRPKHDLAAEIARAAFENNVEALYEVFSKALLRGNPYCFKELSDRAYGRLKERIEVQAGPLHDMTEDELQARIVQLQKQLNLVPALPPADEDDPKVN